MGKAFAGSHKNTGNKQRNGDVVNSGNLGAREQRFNSRLKDQDERNKGVKDSFPLGKTCRKKEIKRTGRKYNDQGSCCRYTNNNSYEVWCICRLVKPCGQCEDNFIETDRDKTPTPGDTADTQGESENSDLSTSPETTNDEDVADGHVDIPAYKTQDCKTRSGVKQERKCANSANFDVKFSRSNCALGEEEINEINDTAGINLQELFSKLDELNEREEVNGFENKQGLHIADTPPGSPTSSMDSASTCSFDHFDFDTSFCSLKSTDTMEPGDLADQLSMVQQMVMEMKTGFSHAMEELSKIQYGDQTLQQQLIDSKKHCSDEITAMRQMVEELKNEVHKLSGHLQEVSDTQRSLQDKLDTYQSDKDMLLEELEQSGAINDQIRQRLSGGMVKENNNIIPPDVAPMVHPYLNSLQNHHRGPDDYNSDSSLTAAVSRSLNLTQALGEKCLNLDFSTSSDDEDNSRHSRSDSGHRVGKRHGSFQYEETNRHSQKVPPHQQVLDEVHREEAARDIVDIEREYCSQLWALLEDYMNPLRDSEILGRRELHLLFPAYIPHIYEQHCISLRKMEERMKKWKGSGVIGDIFAKFTESQDGDGLLLYKDYINDFPTIINSMNRWFSHSPHFRELMQSQCLANAQVLPLLLAPLQQVPKYSILLKTLLKHTPSDHPDRYYLESSLTRLKQFLISMNDDLEHAMQAINISSQPVNRSRDNGNSARSKSSASSGEANHISRDSGVHSNEEERAKSPMSPNTSRRYLLQVLREKREQRIHGQMRKDSHPSTPRGRKQSGYGSHPDLSGQPPGVQDGRMSPFLNSLPQSKMFSSLSKLPLPRENSNSRRSRSHKKPESHKPVINPNYLRPLTPQVFPQSTSAHNFESAKRREEYAEKMRQRPASAMEFSYRSHDQQDEFLESLLQQASLAISPPHSSSSDRSRQELQLSLQKLLAETGNTGEEYGDQDQDGTDGQVSYQRQFMSAKERILRHDMQGEMYDTSQNGENLQEDYGIYGDDDEDYENETEFDHDVKPMKLLQDSHRPKIMVPKWRQNASPQPPGYTHSVSHRSKHQSGSTSEENLAASLAQSLFDDKKQRTLPRDKKSRAHPVNTNDNIAERVPAKGSLKRKSPIHRPGSPEKALARQSPLPSGTNSLPHGKSMSFDGSASRPSNLNLSNANSQGKTSVTQSGVVSTQVRAPQGSKSPDPSTMARPNSFAKLTDVIAYTADCLEKNDTKTLEQGDNSDTEVSEPEMTNVGRLSKLDILADDNMKVSSVDNSVSSASQNAKLVSNEQNMNSKLLFSTSSPERNTSPDTVNTDNVVYYFQHRNQINQGKTADKSESVNSHLPVFASMDKTSTPIKEPKNFPHAASVSPTSETFGNLAKKESHRLVRGDEVNSEIKQKGNTAGDKNKGSLENNDSDMNDDSEETTKDRVLRAVDKLRLSFERKKQLTEERRQSRTEVSSPTNISIQQEFNDMNTVAKKGGAKPVVLRTFSSPSNQVVINAPVEPNESLVNGEPVEQKQGLYKKAGSSKTPKFQSDSAASARQIQKLERATSPTGRSPSPTNMSPYEKFKSQVESSNLPKPARRGTSPQRHSAEVSLIPKRSKSPTRASVERERPKSTNDLGAAISEGDSSNTPVKSAIKETKIPVLRKSGAALSKSSEDVSKIKKKSHFKDQLKNIFGRKKKKSKLYSYNGYDPDEEYNNHVTIATESSFQLSDDVMSFPLTKERRSNSTSQILQSYQFEDDDDDDPVTSM